MQKRLLLLLLAIGIFASYPSYACVGNPAPMSADKASSTYTVNPTDYMNASSVEVQLLSYNATLLAHAETTPGQSVQLSYSGSTEVYLIRKIYKFGESEGFIIVDDIAF